MNQHRIIFACIFFLILNLPNNLFAQSKDTLTYVFIGHLYQGGEPDGKQVDFRVRALDLTQFDGIWLGGDVGTEVGLKYTNMVYLDSIFNLKKPRNHWALGNHDTRNGNIEWIEEITGRPTFYSYSANGLTTVVLNANFSPLDCENINKQFNMIKSICDTISSGHLIFLVHQAIELGVPNLPSQYTYAHQESKHWLANCYTDSSSYVKAIYPMLVEVEKRGVEVLHILGDTGAAVKTFHGVSSDGIDYFACGLGNIGKILSGQPVTDPDMVLLFKHVISTNQLTWEFVELDDL